MANPNDSCATNQTDNTNNQVAIAGADASARLSQEAYCSAPVQAPHQPDHKFHGLNLYFFKIGCRDHSFDVGVNVIGLAKAEVQVGQETRVDAGVQLGPVIGAHAGAGVGFNRFGLHSDVGARGHFVKLVDTGAEVKGNLGPHSGVHVDTGAKVLFAHTRHTFDSSFSDQGFNNGYKGEVGLAKVVGVHAGGHANLNDNSSVGGSAGTTLENASLGAGADVNSNGNRVVNPDVYITADSGQQAKARYDVGAQVGPALDVRAGTAYATTDAYNTQHGGQLSFGVGQSGIGVKATDTLNGQERTASAGIGPDYMSDF